jgi:hypothetical protein
MLEFKLVHIKNTQIENPETEMYWLAILDEGVVNADCHFMCPIKPKKMMRLFKDVFPLNALINRHIERRYGDYSLQIITNEKRGE